MNKDGLLGFGVLWEGDRVARPSCLGASRGKRPTCMARGQVTGGILTMARRAVTEGREKT
jgi:hypothetical protein